VGILTDDMKRVVAEQRLAFVATVAPDGSPNLSPKGAFKVFDDGHLVFADIRSPATVRNLAADPRIEANVVDATLRKGYRFKGTAEVFAEGPRYDELVAFLRATGTTFPIRHAVLIRVERALPVTSPAYDRGDTEAEVAAAWERHWDELKARRHTETAE
jgi:predicted pyridoxine 5'-phosphate oxidase superfamily flavin-nucleotide-binding protein